MDWVANGGIISAHEYAESIVLFKGNSPSPSMPPTGAMLDPPEGRVISNGILPNLISHRTHRHCSAFREESLPRISERVPFHQALQCRIYSQVRWTRLAPPSNCSPNSQVTRRCMSAGSIEKSVQVVGGVVCSFDSA